MARASCLTAAWESFNAHTARESHLDFISAFGSSFTFSAGIPSL